jgi:hypothetical protein
MTRLWLPILAFALLTAGAIAIVNALWEGM